MKKETEEILKDIKQKLAHKIANWQSMNERELLWCLLRLTEAVEDIGNETKDGLG